MKRIRLLLIEDNKLLRDGMLSILKPHKDIIIIAASGDSKNTQCGSIGFGITKSKQFAYSGIG